MVCSARSTAVGGLVWFVTVEGLVAPALSPRVGLCQVLIHQLATCCFTVRCSFHGWLHFEQCERLAAIDVTGLLDLAAGTRCWLQQLPA